MFIAVILGIALGLVMGVTGAGGGILAVPSLVTGLGWSMQQAAPVALIAVSCAAALGTAEGLRHNLVRYRAAMLMAALSLPFTALGILVAHALSQVLLMRIFGAVMVLVALRMLLQGRNAAQQQASTLCALGPIHHDTGRFHWSLTTAGVLAAIGALTGFTSGLLGVGGGFVVVPMLRKFTELSVHSIVATALLVVALVGAGGVVTAVAHGASLPMPATLLFSIAAVAGMLAGRHISKRLAPHHIQRTFAVVLLGVAVALIVCTH
ncbi:MAG: sulfite exporter TauE/SafE family protein [Rhodocyclales bacterium]|nr:sulfite exporter TauE/SafE family protein [Rhodocyclales bacterium]